MPKKQASPHKKTKPIVIAGITLTWKLILGGSENLKNVKILISFVMEKNLGKKN